MSSPEIRDHTDDPIRRAVVAELARDTRLRDAKLDAAVEAGVVTLTGSVDSYMRRWAADAAAYRVPGVRNVVNEIDVILPGAAERTDAQISAAATIALESSASLEPRSVEVAVENGVVTLSGSVEWNFQREDAERLVRGLWGVRGVRNQIAVRARAVLAELKQQIQRALARTIEADGSNIAIDTAGGAVTMRGTATSGAQRDVAERIAWSAPGVTAVDNKITLQSGSDTRADERASSAADHGSSRSS